MSQVLDRAAGCVSVIRTVENFAEFLALIGNVDGVSERLSFDLNLAHMRHATAPQMERYTNPMTRSSVEPRRFDFQWTVLNAHITKVRVNRVAGVVHFEGYTSYSEQRNLVSGFLYLKKEQAYPYGVVTVWDHRGEPPIDYAWDALVPAQRNGPGKEVISTPFDQRGSLANNTCSLHYITGQPAITLPNCALQTSRVPHKERLSVIRREKLEDVREVFPYQGGAEIKLRLVALQTDSDSRTWFRGFYPGSNDFRTVTGFILAGPREGIYGAMINWDYQDHPSSLYAWSLMTG